MDTGILLTVIDDLIQDESDNKVNTLLNNLKTGLTQSKANQLNAGKVIAESIQSLKDNTSKGFYERFTRSYFKTLEEIDGVQYFGEHLINKINSIFEEEQYSIDNQIRDITKLHTERVAYLKKLTETKANLEFLKLEQHYHTEDVYEIGIIIPDQQNLHYANELENSIHNWNLILKGLSEISGNGTEDIKVERVYNGCIELIIEQAFSIASSLGDIMKELVTIYFIIDKVKNHIKGLKKEGVSDKVLKPIEDSQSKKLEDEITKLTDKILKDYKSKDLEKGRENELKTQLKQGIKYIAKSLEKGVEIEIIPPYDTTEDAVIEEADEKEEKAKKVASNKKNQKLRDNINAIKEVGTILQKTKDIQKGIFNLIEGGEGKIDDEDEK